MCVLVLALFVVSQYVTLDRYGSGSRCRRAGEKGEEESEEQEIEQQVSGGMKIPRIYPRAYRRTSYISLSLSLEDQ